MQGRAPFLVREYSLPNGPFVDLPLLLFPCPFHLRHLLLLSGKQRRFMLCIFPFFKKRKPRFPPLLFTTPSFYQLPSLFSLLFL